MTYISSYTGDDSIPVFLSFAIEEYKTHKGISGEEAARALEKAGVLTYLADHYDVLHTQGSRWLMEEIDEIINNTNC